jgi:hypothetical protein
MTSSLDRLALAARRSPRDALAASMAIAICAAVIAYPLVVARYPPMVDLPFHAAETSTLRHYFDASFHFEEQFELRPLAVPYLSMYVTGALLMLVFPALTAVKLAAAGMLALLPLGLATLLRGMKKSPLPAVFGLVIAWGPLTHWGFLNFVGALGLFAMAIGLALRLVDAPSHARAARLSAVLVALFFTHIFRFPLAIASVLGAAWILRPITGRFAVVLPPLVPPLALFAAWLIVRPSSLRAPLHLEPDLVRLAALPGELSSAFNDPKEPEAMRAAVLAVLAVAALSLAARLLDRFPTGAARAPEPARDAAFRARGTLVALAAAAASLALYLTLPMKIGDWWYVYPREATAASFLALAALPDLPRAPLLRAVALGLIFAAPLPLARVVARNYAAWNAATADYDAIVTDIPKAPRLLYLIFDHSGSTRTTSPFTHLPAYVQAERGGWLSYHFAIYGASPIDYRRDPAHAAVIPPPTPPVWEARPELFEVLERGRFFDWFLVRKAEAPGALFEADASIEEVSHRGTWWLYHRRGAPRISTRSLGAR